ncbi:hypothetical protein DICPUDRAFT_26824 [Dictyostelium purpureum]|uniref:Amino acid permease/ SLC12A domain-containing protein n=1 Tax=Dictyostelium purpureum TaxID=5786 RepID=F0Z9E0_DICPU|nr:uncharacterized protein DICPUDRAFT_26824 [Dictyostelium purpureum]EGC39458.1 hypothetical protein DICPUDRAFT_26824 [Dictyostelium purpureum]|eukprot:XP_003284016.1 hypothetical protein DICPUDRAFT_26824 [Dictyostelium purpureum]
MDNENSIGSDNSSVVGQLKKNNVGTLECIALSVGGIGLSTALFFVYPNIASVAGTAVPFTLIIGTICTLSMAYTICTFSKYVSSSASLFLYISEGLGNSMGFLSVWVLLVGYLTVMVAAILMFVSTLSDVITRHTTFHFPWILSAILVVTVIPTLAYIGIDVVLRTTLISMALETIVMLVLTIFVVVKGGDQGNYPLAFTPVGDYAPDISGIARGLVFCVFIFIGFEGAANLGRETRNPKKSIPIAVVGAVLVAAVWLIWASYAMIVATGPSNIFSMRLDQSPIEQNANRYVSYWFSIVIDVAGIVSTFNVCSSWFNIVFRILYSIGKTIKENTRNPISKLSNTNKKFKTPHVAIITLTVFIVLCCFIIACSTKSIYTTHTWDVYNYLSYISAIPIILVFIVTNIALVPYMKKKQPQDYRFFNHLICPCASGLLFILLLVGNFYPEPPSYPLPFFLYALAGFIIIGIALMFYLTKFKKQYINNMIFEMSK